MKWFLLTLLVMIVAIKSIDPFQWITVPGFIYVATGSAVSKYQSNGDLMWSTAISANTLSVAPDGSVLAADSGDGVDYWTLDRDGNITSSNAIPTTDEDNHILGVAFDENSGANIVWYDDDAFSWKVLTPAGTGQTNGSGVTGIQVSVGALGSTIYTHGFNGTGPGSLPTVHAVTAGSASIAYTLPSGYAAYDTAANSSMWFAGGEGDNGGFVTNGTWTWEHGYGGRSIVYGLSASETGVYGILSVEFGGDGVFLSKWSNSGVLEWTKQLTSGRFQQGTCAAGPSFVYAGVVGGSEVRVFDGDGAEKDPLPFSAGQRMAVSPGQPGAFPEAWP